MLPHLSRGPPPLAQPQDGREEGARHRQQDPGLSSPPTTHSTSSSTPGPPQRGMGLGPQIKGSPPPPAGGALPADEIKSCSPLPQAAVHPISNTQAGQSHGQASPCSGVPPWPLPWTHGPGFPGGQSPQHSGGSPGWHHALGDARQYVWGVRMKSRSSSLRIHFMSLLTALMAPALVPRGL